MTMHKALHPSDEFEKKKEEELVALKIVLDALIQWLEDYIERHRRKLITASRNNTDDTRINKTKITKKQKEEEKQLYRRFKWLTNVISDEKTQIWLKNGNLKRETEFLIIAGQNNTIRTNHMKGK